MDELKGKIFGKLTVLNYSHSNNGAVWHCLCECGKMTQVPTRSLNYGTTKSCGCGSKEQARKNAIKSATDRRLPYPYPRQLKDLYRNMMSRCYDRKNKRWDNYGGRGIYVCKEWIEDHIEFYRWAHENGHAPGMQIDRKNVHGNYTPSNCRFVTATVQQNNTTRNRLITYAGKTRTVMEWVRCTGISNAAILHRLKRGWSIHDTLTTPVRERKK